MMIASSETPMVSVVMGPSRPLLDQPLDGVYRGNRQRYHRQEAIIAIFVLYSEHA